MQTRYTVAAMIEKGNHVLTNPQNPTYFPKKNIQAASRTMFQEVLPEYLMRLSAIPQWE